jgi:hypothetical protein
MISAGKDITHLLNGLGKEHGLGKLFHRMQKLAWGNSDFVDSNWIIALITNFPMSELSITKFRFD